MSFVHYQPNILSDLASEEEAQIATTTSEILLSRGIARTDLPAHKKHHSTVINPILGRHRYHDMLFSNIDTPKKIESSSRRVREHGNSNAVPKRVHADQYRNTY
jgi:hypothetical protein